MWVKICANTSLEDAQMAAEMGADAVGFVFAPSSRRVTPEEAGAISRSLVGGVERIGVFPAMSLEAVRSATVTARLTGVQLHGGYEREVVRGLREEFGSAITIAQTLHWVVGEGELAGPLIEQVREIRAEGRVNRVLVDSKAGSALGGTGTAFDWEAAQALFRETDGVAMIVAGGLNADNVGEAAKRLRPWGVDVATGVEAVVGRKDPERLRLFLERAKAAG